MNLVEQVLKTISRRPLRALLTAAGTAIGIATIVALLAVASGAQQSAGRFYDLGPSDLGLFQANAADPTTSVLPTSMIAQLQAVHGVAAATPLVLLLGDVRHAPGAIAFGANPDGFLLRRAVFVAGRMFDSDRQAIVGSSFATSDHLHVGSTLVLSGRHLTVAGIYHLGVAVQDAGLFVPLAVAQSVAGRAGEATTLAVALTSGTKPAAAKAAIRRRFAGLEIISDGDEAARAGVNAQLLSKMALVIAVLAMVIGGIGVVNTMLISVNERRAEYALRSAVGWSKPQIAGLVLTEGMLTSLLGAALGLLLGTVGASALVHLLGAGEYVSPNITAWILGRGLLIGILVGVLGGLLPAWRATRISPAAVLAER